MNQFFILAFIITPIVVIAIGYAAVRLHERAQAGNKPARRAR